MTRPYIPYAEEKATKPTGREITSKPLSKGAEEVEAEAERFEGVFGLEGHPDKTESVGRYSQQGLQSSCQRVCVMYINLYSLYYRGCVSL